MLCVDLCYLLHWQTGADGEQTASQEALISELMSPPHEAVQAALLATAQCSTALEHLLPALQGKALHVLLFRLIPLNAWSCSTMAAAARKHCSDPDTLQRCNVFVAALCPTRPSFAVTPEGVVISWSKPSK